MYHAIQEAYSNGYSTGVRPLYVLENGGVSEFAWNATSYIRSDNVSYPFREFMLLSTLQGCLKINIDYITHISDI